MHLQSPFRVAAHSEFLERNLSQTETPFCSSLSGVCAVCYGLETGAVRLKNACPFCC